MFKLPLNFLNGSGMVVGDSYTVGYANEGGTTKCNMTACNPVTGVCLPEVDSQNNTASWGPLTAANFSADYQVIAWSGAGLVTDSNPEALVALHPTVPLSIAEEIYPQDVSLLSRQVAGVNGSVVSNYSSWVPQVIAVHHIARPSTVLPGLECFVTPVLVLV